MKYTIFLSIQSIKSCIVKAFSPKSTQEAHDAQINLNVELTNWKQKVANFGIGLQTHALEL